MGGKPCVRGMRMTVYAATPPPLRLPPALAMRYPGNSKIL